MQGMDSYQAATGKAPGSKGANAKAPAYKTGSKLSAKLTSPNTHKYIETELIVRNMLNNSFYA